MSLWLHLSTLDEEFNAEFDLQDCVAALGVLDEKWRPQPQ